MKLPSLLCTKKKSLKLLTLVYIFSLLACVYSPNDVSALEPPYPPSQVIESITFDLTTHKREAPGSDNWPMTWAEDDNLYTCWGDGGGFGGANYDGRVSWGLARIEGDPENFAGYNVLGGKYPENPGKFKGMSYGILSIEGVLYSWSCGGPIAYSYDHGATWQEASWSIGEFTNFEPSHCPNFLNFGKDYQGARDDFVYAYTPFGWDATRLNAKILLMRVPKNQILDKGAYEFFNGINSAGTPIWTKDSTQYTSVFNDPNGVGVVVSVTYNAAINRYLLTMYHNLNAGWGVFDAPTPWGPWTTVGYFENWPNDGVWKFFFVFPTKWISADGKTMWMVATGRNEWDSFNLIKTTLTMKIDDTPPTISSVNATETTVKVVFDEPVEQTSAVTISNYAIDSSINITGASLNPDLRTVTLTTSPHTEGLTYTITINNIKDNDPAPNTILPNSTFTYSYSNALIYASFETDNDGFGDPIGNTSYNRDSNIKSNGSYSMHVSANGSGSKLSIDINPSNWNLDFYPYMEFDYKIPSGVPVGLFFDTGYNDWICLGGTSSHNHASQDSNDIHTLIDDNKWHVISINVKDAIRNVNPAADRVAEFEFYTEANGTSGDEFWFDEFKIITQTDVVSDTTSPAPPTGLKIIQE